MSAFVAFLCFVVWLPVILAAIAVWSALKSFSVVGLQILTVISQARSAETFFDYLFDICFRGVGVLLQGLGAFAFNFYSSFVWCWLEVSNNSILAMLVALFGLSIHFSKLKAKASNEDLSHFEGYTLGDHFGYSIIAVLISFTAFGLLATALIMVVLTINVAWSILTGGVPFTEGDISIFGGFAMLFAFLGSIF